MERENRTLNLAHGRKKDTKGSRVSARTPMCLAALPGAHTSAVRIHTRARIPFIPLPLTHSLRAPKIDGRLECVEILGASDEEHDSDG